MQVPGPGAPRYVGTSWIRPQVRAAYPYGYGTAPGPQGYVYPVRMAPPTGPVAREETHDTQGTQDTQGTHETQDTEQAEQAPSPSNQSTESESHDAAELDVSSSASPFPSAAAATPAASAASPLSRREEPTEVKRWLPGLPAWLKGPSEPKKQESDAPSTNTKAARQRDQPSLAIIAEAFASGDDEAHLQRGCEAGVSMLELAPGLEGDEEAEWPSWKDPWKDGSERGGAVAFLPASPSTSSCIYFVHGGGFEYGGPTEDGYDSLCSRIAAASGQVVVCPDHPLSGDNRPFKAPAIMEALLKGLRWLARFDPGTRERRSTRIVLAGDSAGATQALSLLLQVLSDAELKTSISGLVLISPWLDLTCGSHTYVSNAFAEESRTGDLAFRSHADENRAGFRSMALTYTGSTDLLKDEVFSPYWLARNTESELVKQLQTLQLPVWMCTGAAETLAGEVLDFAQKLQDVPMELWLHEGMFHDWVMYVSDHPFPSKDAAMQNLIDFLEKTRTETWKPKGIQYYIERWR